MNDSYSKIQLETSKKWPLCHRAVSEQARKITLPEGRFTPQKNFANRTQSQRATLLHYHQKHQMYTART